MTIFTLLKEATRLQPTHTSSVRVAALRRHLHAHGACAFSPWQG
jgi:hypothetical protein